MEDPSDSTPIPIPIESSLLSISARRLFDLLCGDVLWTNTTQVYSNVLKYDGSLRVCRVPLDIADMLEKSYPPGNKSIHMIRPEGENFAIVYDYNDWIKESIIRRMASLAEVKSDLDAKHRHQLRHNRFNRMISTYIRLGRFETKAARDVHKIVLTQLESQFLDFGESGVESIFKQIEDTMSLRLDYRIHIYEQPNEEEIEQATDPIQ